MQGLNPTGDPNQNRRILVIDDNPAIHQDFRKIFASGKAAASLEDAESAFFGETNEAVEVDLDVEIVSANQGQEGLQKVIAAIQTGRPYAMAFVDMRMPPGWDGLTTIERLWEVAPDLQVVICSAYSDNSWSDICKRLGRSDRLLILKKPFDNAEVCQLALALTQKWNLAKQAKLKRDELVKLVDARTDELRQKDIALRHKHKLEAVGSLAGGIAHEFNNLLQAIRGYTSFAREEVPVDGQAYEDLGHVIDATDRASGIASQLLSFSRRRPTEKSLLPAAKICKLTLAMIKPLMPSNVELQVDLNQESMLVCADANLLSQALLNLCINARDAMPMGGRVSIILQERVIPDSKGRVVSVTEPLLAAGRYAVFSVSDTGCGMSSEVQERIFEPFYTTKQVGKGTGMGLAIVFSALQEIDGTVTVESEQGVGSTFRLFVPISLEPSNDLLNTVASQEGTFSGSETVLLAEDDLMVRSVAARLLRHAGYCVIEACDGEDAITKFEANANSIELAILDLMMPNSSGSEVADRIKAIRPETKVIFCTGYDPADVCEDAFPDSLNKVIQKPIESAAFLSAVREALNEVVLCQSH